MDGGSCVSMWPFYLAAPAGVLEKSQAAGGPPLTVDPSPTRYRAARNAGGDAAERAQFRIHVRLVAVLRVERHVCQPHRSRGLQLTERSTEAQDAPVLSLNVPDPSKERLNFRSGQGREEIGLPTPIWVD